MRADGRERGRLDWVVMLREIREEEWWRRAELACMHASEIVRCHISHRYAYVVASHNYIARAAAG